MRLSKIRSDFAKRNSSAYGGTVEFLFVRKRTAPLFFSSGADFI